MAFVAQNGFWLTRDGFAPDPLNSNNNPLLGGVLYDGVVQAIAAGELRLASGNELQVYSGDSNIRLGAGGVTDVMTVRPDGVDIQGTLRVLGSIDALMSSELLVRDKLVRVCHVAPEQGQGQGQGQEPELSVDVADGAGLAVGGESQPVERSVRWRRAHLAAHSSPPECSPEPAATQGVWEVRGGGLRLAPASASNAPAEQEVAYSMHINERDELVIYKVVTRRRLLAPDAATTTYQRVFTFGGTTTEPLTLPTSRNPYYYSDDAS